MILVHTTLKNIYISQAKYVLPFRILCREVTEDLATTTDQYINVINLDKVRIKVEFTEVEELKVKSNNGKDKMMNVLI